MITCPRPPLKTPLEIDPEDLENKIQRVPFGASSGAIKTSWRDSRMGYPIDEPEPDDAVWPD